MPGAAGAAASTQGTMGRCERLSAAAAVNTTDKRKDVQLLNVSE